MSNSSAKPFTDEATPNPTLETKQPRTPKKKRTPKVDCSKFAIDVRPEIFYVIQDKLTEQGISLINPATYKTIQGAVNVPYIYLSSTAPRERKNIRRSFGYLQSVQSDQPQKNNEDSPKEINVDAILYQHYPASDLASGFDPQSGITYFVIKVWHDGEVKKWQKIAANLASNFLAKFIVEDEDENGEITTSEQTGSLAFFQITSAVRPTDPNAPRSLIINPSKQVQEDAIGTFLEDDPDDEFYEDDYRLRPS